MKVIYTLNIVEKIEAEIDSALKYGETISHIEITEDEFKALRAKLPFKDSEKEGFYYKNTLIKVV